MPDPSHRPYHPMLIIRPDSLPRLWWLFPWSIACRLHKNAVALRQLADKTDDENRLLRQEVTRLAHSRDHWLAKHDRAYAVAMHNERVIADMEERYEQTLEGQLGRVLAMPESPASHFCRQYKAETGQDAIGHLSAKDMWELTSPLSKKNGGETTWEEFCAQRSEDIKNLTR